MYITPVVIEKYLNQPQKGPNYATDTQCVSRFKIKR